MKKTKDPTLKEFIDSLNHVKELNVDSRFKILFLQLYAEHYVNEILLNLVDKESIGKEIIEEISFPKKLKILKKIKVLNDQTEDVLTILSGLRNLAVHKLVISDKEINNKLKERKLGFNYIIDKMGEKFINIDLEQMYKDKKLTEFSQLEVSSVLVIGILYSKLKMINKEEVDYYISPELEEGKPFVILKLHQKVEEEKD